MLCLVSVERKKKIKNMAQTICTLIGSTNYLTLMQISDCNILSYVYLVRFLIRLPPLGRRLVARGGGAPMRASVSLSASREIVMAGEALVCGPFHHPQSHFR
jgi:hypothetical protein